MILDHKLEKTTNPQTGDKIQTEFENIAALYLLSLKPNTLNVQELTHKSPNRQELYS